MNRSIFQVKHVAPFVYILGTTCLIYLFFWQWVYDDPFITFRYARNLAHGFGFVYNAWEKVQSTTTPLLTIILSGISYLRFDLPRAANFLGSLSLALGGWFLWDLAQSWKTPQVGWAALFLYPTFPLLFTTLGSEMPLFLALCLAALAFNARGKVLVSAGLLGLSVLTRPDGMLLAVLLGIYSFYKNRSISQLIKPGIVFLAVVLPWFMFAWLYFGSPIPATLAAKQAQGAMSISTPFAPRYFVILKSYAKEPVYWLEAALAVIGIVVAFSQHYRWGLVLIWGGCQFFVYTLLGVSGYYWYYAPLVPPFISAVSLGIAHTDRVVATTLHRITQKTRYQTRVNNHAGMIVLVAIAFLGQLNTLRAMRGYIDQRYEIYKAVGEWLHDNTEKNSKIGMLEVGMIGYFADRAIIDFAGLIQPEVARQLKPDSTYEDSAIWAVNRYHPDLIILHKGLFSRLESQLNEMNCQFIQNFNGENYHYKGALDIYSCAY